LKRYLLAFSLDDRFVGLDQITQRLPADGRVAL
jgi:hypothetical protein